MFKPSVKFKILESLIWYNSDRPDYLIFKVRADKKEQITIGKVAAKMTIFFGVSM